MKFAWDAIFGTPVDILRANRLVEVGPFFGDGTRRYLEYCRAEDAVLQTIDPLSSDPDYARQQQEAFDGVVPLIGEVIEHRRALAKTRTAGVA